MVAGAHADAAGLVRVVRIVCALLLLAGCTPGVSRPNSSGAGATPASTTIEVDGRPVAVYVPASRPPNAPAGLVVVLHGYTGTAEAAVGYFGLRRIADERGFVVAAPQGTADREGHAFWNASKACCNFDGSTVDDSGFLSRVIATVVSAQSVDPARVSVLGHSNGGFMAHRLACEHADQVAAIASLAGALDADAGCDPSRPVSVLQVQGTADDTIRYDGGDIDGSRYTSAVETVARWRRVNGCPVDGRPGAPLDADAQVAGEDLTPITWTGCRGNTDVALWTIAHGSHVPTLTPAFTAALVDWFEAHERRAAPR